MHIVKRAGDDDIDEAEVGLPPGLAARLLVVAGHYGVKGVER